jgi:serine/threonine-protein kinase
VRNGALAIPWSFTPDGRRLAYYAMSEDTALDLWTVPVEVTASGLRAGTSEPFRRTPAFEVYPAFSPDGRWIAYGSNESGSWEVYVRAFPDSGRQVQVSVHGGRIPAWSPATNELLYETDDHRVMAATYAVEQGEFVPAAPRPWSTMRLGDTGVIANFDVGTDGRSIAALVPASDEPAPRNLITFVTNIFDEIERRAAARN